MNSLSINLELAFLVGSRCWGEPNLSLRDGSNIDADKEEEGLAQKKKSPHQDNFGRIDRRPASVAARTDPPAPTQ